MNRLLALIMLCGALALPALPVHADAMRDLFEAALRGNAYEVKAALAASADPGARDEWANTPLHLAVLDNSNPSAWAAMIEAERERGALTEDQVAEIQHWRRYLPPNSNPSVITALIEGGADPNARAQYGATPLHRAAYFNSNPSVITALIEGGADPGAGMRGEYMGLTPLHAAAEVSFNPSVITALIEGGANPNARDEDGYTPLHFAAELNSNPSVIMALIEGGANAAEIDIDGFTPFDYAKENEALKGTDAYWLLNEGRFE